MIKDIILELIFSIFVQILISELMEKTIFKNFLLILISYKRKEVFK